MLTRARAGTADLVIALRDTGRSDVARVGGKNASLGELVGALGGSGVRVPSGFATTADAYRRFIADNGLEDSQRETLRAWSAGRITLAQAGASIRLGILGGRWPEAAARAIAASYRALCEELGTPNASVAVRSSATAEDLPEASFAGQLESFLNIRGETALLDACKRCYASLFTDRALAYREAHGFDHLRVALSVGVQQMVRSDGAGAGVMFSIDPETGFPRVVVINAAWGLGETVVQGQVDPDEYVVFKPLLQDATLAPIVDKRCGDKASKLVYGADADTPTRLVPAAPSERAAWVLSDDEILQLARWACHVERHYGTAMDLEWAKDAGTGQLFIVQARPETVQSRRRGTELRTYRLDHKGKALLSGLAVGEAAVAGKVRIMAGAGQPEDFPDGAILVAENTDPDWVPIMRKAAAIVTDHGGRTSHAAICSRELGVPALIGTGAATRLLREGQEITVSCAEGDTGRVYEGTADIRSEVVPLDQIPATRTQVLFNMANPSAAFRWWRLPADGIGLARMEFVIGDAVRIHPMALAHFDRVADPAAREAIERLTAGYPRKEDYFVDRLSRGLARLAALCHPQPVIVRMSDFKSNEYANLVGGAAFEPAEDNPMLGVRGASRYYSPRYRDGFALECRALARLRDVLGFRNVVVMIPFCRTPAEADRVLAVMAEHGLVRGRDGLRVYVMCEIPSNVILAEEFARRFDGFSIGSNDLTQLTLGVDRDSDELAPLFRESDPAVAWMIETVIARAHRCGATVGLCGEAPSSHPEFAQFLVRAGIDSISVNPGSFVAVKRNVAKAETLLDDVAEATGAIVA